MAVPRIWPLVTVIVPTYNVEAYVDDCLNSILSQDYPEMEVIVVDDGSTDGTVAALAAYGDRVRLVRQENRGAAAARNHGLALARGTYVTFLDGDDIWLPGKVKAQVVYMECHPNVGMTYGRWEEWRRTRGRGFAMPEWVERMGTHDEEAVPGIVPEGSGWLYHKLLTDFLVTTIAVMLRRGIVEQIGYFDETLERGEDYEYWLRVSRVTEIHKLDRVMALYRLHGHSTTFQCPERNYAAEVIERAVERWGKVGPNGVVVDERLYARHVGRLWSGFGAKQLRAGKPRWAARSLVRSVRVEPLVLRHWLILAKAIWQSAWPQRGRIDA